jgi:hypothetical protein
VHFEVPKLRKHSLKEFAQHYLMIVLSILTALGLEQWIERAHHRHAAEYASTQIEAELRANLNDIRTSKQVNAQNLGPLNELNDAIIADVRKGVPDKLINQHVQSLQGKFVLSVNWPTFASQAWDVAVANQSATWIDTATLRRFSAAYAAQREAATWVTHDSTLALDAPRMVALRTRIQLGVDIDPIEFLGVVRQMINTNTQTQLHLEQTEKQVVAALPAGGH